ncbi:DsbA family protein [Enterobacter hormaechei]|uniref:DsbA family protein n=1 Tax=Enterobacter hormaechei TaxID=158836 RepID=UPI0024BDD9C5|nr:DsbA family protein [Enterobacter hormaechei]MDJ1452177.1 DsbA family protein [Enterobacter hormaechei subsp. xiangfangensis]
MSKEFYLKPMATILISAVIATAASALITATYFKPKVLSEEEIGKIAATYLVKNPHYLVEAGKALENQNVSASVERIIPYAPALLDTKETPNIGPDDADVAVIEFFDYQCIYCMRVTPVVESVMNQSKDVKFFFKEFPIFAGSKPVSAMGAATGLHVYQNFGAEAYRKYHNNLMAVAHTFMTSQRKFELTDFNTVVEKSGFNSTLSDREKHRYENVISGNMQLGEALGITGTPGFIIMNMKKPNAATTTFIPGAMDAATLQGAIEKARGA